MEKRIYLFFCLLLLASILAFTFNHISKKQNAEAIENILKKYSEDIAFEENKGQWDDQILYRANTGQAYLQFMEDGVHFTVFEDEKAEKGHAWKMKLNGMNSKTTHIGKSLKSTNTNYMNGKGTFNNIENFAEVWYEDVYPDTDLRFYNRGGGEIEYDFVLQPKANIENISLSLEGTEGLSIDAEGNLILETSVGPMVMGKPYTYQVIDGVEKEIPSKYELKDNSFTFAMLEDYDKNHPLVIDPIVLEYSARIGSTSNAMTFPYSGQNYNFSAINSAGEAFIMGTVNGVDLPVTVGAFQTTYGGGSFKSDICVAKLSSDGSTLLYCTYLGGSDHDYPRNISINSNDECFILGESISTDYPVTPGAFQTSLSGQTDYVLTRLNSTGTNTIYSTYIGGSEIEEYNGDTWDNPLFHVTDNNEVIMTGLTASPDFPSTSGAYRETYDGGASSDVFVLKMNATGDALVFGTYLGVNTNYGNHGAAINSLGQVAVHSTTDNPNYPTTLGAYMSTEPTTMSGSATVALLLNADGSDIQYATYALGASGNDDEGPGVLFNDNDKPIFYGFSEDFLPATTGALNFGVEGDPFNFSAFQLSDDGTQLLKSMNGASGLGRGMVSLMSNGDLIVAGDDWNGTNPITPNAINGIDRTYVTVYSSDFTQIKFGSSFPIDGGGFQDMVLDNNDNLHVVLGYSEVTTLTDDAMQMDRLSTSNYIYMKINSNYELEYSTYLGGDGQHFVPTIYTDDEGSAYIMGASATSYPATEGAWYTGTARSIVFSKFSLFCGPIVENVISPASQDHCIFGSPDPFTGNEIETNAPNILRDGVAEEQAAAAGYQWQQSPDGVTGWIDIPGAILKDYLPSELATTTYYRRLIVGSGCDGEIAASNVAVINIGTETAPISDAGGEFLVCQGGSVQIGQLATPGSSAIVSYSWDPVVGLSNPNIAQPIATPPTSGVYTVEVTDANGCVHRDQAVITVIAPDAGPDQSLCNGLAAIQIGTPGLPAASGVSYSWSPITGLDNPNIAQPLASPSVATTYTLTMTGPNGCPLQDQVTVTPLTVNAVAGGDRTICFGNSTTLGEASEPNTFYGWAPGTYLNNQNISNPISLPDQMPAPQDNPLKYYVTKMDLATECTDVDSVLVYVNRADANEDGCGPRYIGTPDHSLGRATYVWSVVSGDAASLLPAEVNIPMPFVAPNTTTTYQVDVTWNGVTCTDQVVVPPCGCTLDVAYSSDYDCLVGGNNTFIWAIGQDTTLYDYVWTPTTGLTHPNSSMTGVGTLTSNVTYTIQSYLKYDGSPSCSETITVFAAPATYPTALAQDGVTCSGTGVQIGYPAVTGWDYEWFPDTDLSDPLISNPIATPTQTREYTLTATDQVTGCTNDTTIVVVVRDPIIDAGPDGEFCNGAIIQLGTPAVANQSYSWEPQIGLNGYDTAQPIDTIYTNMEYILTVTDLETGCFVKDTVNYILDVAPIADAGADQEVCPGGTVVIGSPEQAGLIYQWSPAAGLSDPTAAQPVVTTSSNITYILSVSNGNIGCFDTDEVVVTMGTCTPPVVDPGPDAEICIGASTQIGTAPTGGLTYLWTPATGLDNPTAAQPNANPTETTTYVLTVEDGTGATNSASVTVTVWDIPTADAGAAVSTCEGGQPKLGTPAEDGMTYSWAPATDLNDPTLAQPILTATSSGTYTVTATNAGGCSATSEVVVTVNTAPTADAGADAMTCNGVTIGTAAIGGMTYEWSPAEGLNSTTVAQPTANPNVETEYIVTVTDASGCTATDEVIVSPSAEADAGGNKSVCEGSEVMIGTPDMSGGTSTYSWSPATGLSASNVAQPMASPSTTTTYTVEVTNGGCIKTDQVVVTVNPISADAGADQYICGGASVRIGTPAETGRTYLWVPSAGLDDPTLAQPMASPSTNETYTVIVSDPSTGCVTSDEVTIVLFGTAPVADAGDDATSCNGTGVQIGAAPTAGLTYVWTPNIGLSDPFISNPIASPPTTTTYEVQSFDAVTGCANYDEVTVTVADCAGIGDYTWLDANNDGVQQGIEVPVTNVTVNLIQDGVVINTTTTNGTGYYFFDNVPAGTYCIAFDASTSPDGTFAPAKFDQGGDDAFDSDMNPITGKTNSFYFDPAGGDDLSFDAGFIEAQNVGDFVWYDADGNGEQNSEAGIEGVTVTLYDQDGLIVGTTTTDNTGYYLFENVPVGIGYCIAFDESTQTSGYENLVFSDMDNGSTDANDSDADPTTGKTTPFEVVAGSDKLDIDAGLYEGIKIGDLVWQDYIVNGVQDPTELVIPGVIVTLYDNNTGLVVDTKVTDEDGKYCFFVREGDYYLEFNAGSTGTYYLVTSQSTGADRGIDNNVDPTLGVTDVLTITLAEGDNLTIDAGFYDPYNRELPVEWSYFNVQNKDCSNIITWGTETEENTKHFEILRSHNGLRFESIGVVDAVGFSAEALDYEFIDTDPYVNSYYKIRSVDFDGETQFTKAKAIKSDCMENGNEISIYPNPTKYDLFLNYESLKEESDVMISISNILGQEVKTQMVSFNEGVNNIRIEISDLPLGEYILRMSTNDMRTYHVEKFIKIQD